MERERERARARESARERENNSFSTFKHLSGDERSHRADNSFEISSSQLLNIVSHDAFDKCHKHLLLLAAATNIQLKSTKFLLWYNNNDNNCTHERGYKERELGGLMLFAIAVCLKVRRLFGSFSLSSFGQITIKQLSSFTNAFKSNLSPLNILRSARRRRRRECISVVVVVAALIISSILKQFHQHLHFSPTSEHLYFLNKKQNQIINTISSTRQYNNVPN